MDAPTNRTNFLFNCPEIRVDYFTLADDLNGGCLLEGQVCHHEGTHFGSLSISTVGSAGCEPQLIYGVPRFTMPFEEGKFKADIVDLADTTSCVALSFPPGLFVQIYKFYREGEVCCSIKSRGLASVADSFFYPFRTILRNVLNVPKTGFTEWALARWPQLQDPVVQSLTFLLHGTEVSRFFLEQPRTPTPKTPTQLTLLFITQCDGQIYPAPGGTQIEANAERVAVAAEQLARSGGALLFALGADGKTSAYRTVYRIPPLTWWPEPMELTSAVHRAIDGVRANARPWVMDAIREEACVFGPVAVWRHYSRYFAELIKTHLASALHAPPAIVLIGVPGSGKSTFSSMLLSASPLWRHVSQDLLGTKKACRAVMQEATQAGLGVIVLTPRASDRCNVEVEQRKGWLNDLQKCGVHTVIAVWLDIETAVCKNRVMTRADHPTLPAVERSKAVVDEFHSNFEKPAPKEGFAEVMRLKTEKEVKAAIEEIAKWNATRDLKAP